MVKSYIVSVLDYFEGGVDIFQVSVPENEDDIDTYIQDSIEEHGHHLEDCYYLYCDPNKFKMKVDL
jgi:hypothetical protein